MLPRVNTSQKQMSSTGNMRTQNIASKLITEDCLKSMLSRTQNQSYKPWKNMWSPRNPQSPFGDFPKDFMLKTVSSPKLGPVHESTFAKTSISNSKANLCIYLTVYRRVLEHWKRSRWKTCYFKH